MNNLINFLKIFLSIPKIIYVNFKVLNIKDAIKLPILVLYNVKVRGLKKGSIQIKGETHFFQIKIGYGGSNAIISNRYGQLVLKNDSKLIFKGKAHFGEGIVFYSDGGTTNIHDGFSCNKNCFFSLNNNATFGKDCMIGWNVAIRDSDGHKIVPNSNKKSDINVGNHVWICSHVDILKGTTIGNNCVIAYRSCCIGGNYKDNLLIGGYPAKIIKENINWEF